MKKICVICGHVFDTKYKNITCSCECKRLYVNIQQKKNYTIKNDIHPTINKKCYDIREKDKKRIQFIKNCGINVLIIWESDYINNKELTKQLILDFLNNNEN